MLFLTIYRTLAVCISIFIGIMCIPLHALPSLADYAADTSLQNVSISSSGQRLAFFEKKNGMSVIRIVDLQKRKSLAAFDVSDITPHNIYFIGDDKVIVKASGGKRRVYGYKGRLSISTAFVYSITTKKIRQLLTPGEVIYTGQTGLGHILAVSKDQKTPICRPMFRKVMTFPSRPLNTC